MHIQATAPAAQRLYDAFVSRPLGLLTDTTILWEIGYILRRQGFGNVSPRDAKDLLAFDEKQAEAALKLLPGLDLKPAGDPALALVARSAV